MKKRNVVFTTLLSIILIFSFNGAVFSYPGSGQGKWEEAEIQIFEQLEEIENITETGIIINPLMDNPSSFDGENAVFGNSCLTCHGGDSGAHTTEQPYHGAITVDLIRTADDKSMVQDDGTLLIEVDPNGGVTNYKLVVGLSEDVYDGGHDDDRALAGWHFALPRGLHMDLPYCMHIIGPELSKVYPDNENAVFSDVKVAVDENFEEKKGVLQIISGTQNATPNQNKVYGSLIVEYKFNEDVPVEEDLTVAELPSPTAPGTDIQQASVVGATDSDTEGVAYPFYYNIIIGAVILAIILFFFRNRSAKTES